MAAYLTELMGDEVELLDTLSEEEIDHQLETIDLVLEHAHDELPEITKVVRYRDKLSEIRQVGAVCKQDILALEDILGEPILANPAHINKFTNTPSEQGMQYLEEDLSTFVKVASAVVVIGLLLSGAGILLWNLFKSIKNKHRERKIDQVNDAVKQSPSEHRSIIDNAKDDSLSPDDVDKTYANLGDTISRLERIVNEDKANREMQKQKGEVESLKQLIRQLDDDMSSNDVAVKISAKAVVTLNNFARHSYVTSGAFKDDISKHIGRNGTLSKMNETLDKIESILKEFRSKHINDIEYDVSKDFHEIEESVDAIVNYVGLDQINVKDNAYMEATLELTKGIRDHLSVLSAGNLDATQSGAKQIGGLLSKVHKKHLVILWDGGKTLAPTRKEIDDNERIVRVTTAKINNLNKLVKDTSKRVKANTSGSNFSNRSLLSTVKSADSRLTLILNVVNSILGHYRLVQSVFDHGTDSAVKLTDLMNRAETLDRKLKTLYSGGTYPTGKSKK